MYLMIDNYDSFVFNLARYLEELGENVKMVRNDRITVGKIESMLAAGSLSGVILSPGPKSPVDCGNCKEILVNVAGRIPVLGVCLGHQIIGHVFGAVVQKGKRPMHGKVTSISTDGTGLFLNLPRTFQVTRYHSLVVSEEGFPEELQVNAWSEDGAIMAVSHRKMPIYGVQFHPEAVLTEYGHELLANFTRICREWWKTHEYKDSQTICL